jgi:hypothetical protein
MMVALAVGVETCAALLSVDSQTLRACLERGEVQGVRLGEEWRVSLFEVARLLSTSVPELLEVAEDFGLAHAVYEVDGDESFTPAEGRAVYEQILRNSHA